MRHAVAIATLAEKLSVALFCFTRSGKDFADAKKISKGGIYKDAVFGAKSPLRHINAEKGMKTKGFRGFDVLRISTSEALFLFM